MVTEKKTKPVDTTSDTRNVVSTKNQLQTNGVELKQNPVTLLLKWESSHIFTSSHGVNRVSPDILTLLANDKWCYYYLIYSQKMYLRYIVLLNVRK